MRLTKKDRQYCAEVLRDHAYCLKNQEERCWYDCIKVLEEMARRLERGKE